MNVIKLSSVTIPANRQRREFDPQKLEELKASIELSPARNTQLLHPPVLRREGDSLILVAGETRLKAISDIFALGGGFLYSGKIFTAEAGEIPYTDLGELSPLEAMEAELDENIRRKDLTWQEHAAAVKALHELRTAQKAELRHTINTSPERSEATIGLPIQTIADTAKEVLGRGDGYYQDTIRKELIVAKHLDNPAVASAKTVNEAFKILKKEEARADATQRAAAMGSTAIEETYQILNMDCLAYMANPANHGKFDVILTDAPYGMGADEFGDGAGRLAGTDHQYDDSKVSWLKLMAGGREDGGSGPGWCDLSYLVAKPEAHAYVFCDFDNFHDLKFWMSRAGWDVFRTPLIAYKQNSGRVPRPEHGPRRQYELVLYAIKGGKRVNHIYPDVIPCQGDENMGHGAQKPVALFQNLLQRSVRPGDRVLDSFAGSGPLLEAAANCQCYSVLIEAVPAYYGMILKRAERLSSQSNLLAGL